MQRKAAQAVPVQAVDDPAASDVTIRWLVGPDSTAPNFHMREFEIAPGGHTPQHCHQWEHECYILAGQGKVLDAGKRQPVAAGDVLYIPGGEEHQFVNDSDQPLKFLCMVPVPKDE